MNALLYIQALEKILSGYQTGKFDELSQNITDECTWESDWKTDSYHGRREIEKYYLRKGVILNRCQEFPTGYVVELFGSEDHLDGKGLYLKQTCDGQNYDLILKVKLDSNACIAAINLCMKELYRFRYFNAAIPQY